MAPARVSPYFRAVSCLAGAEGGAQAVAGGEALENRAKVTLLHSPRRVFLSRLPEFGSNNPSPSRPFDPCRRHLINKASPLARWTRAHAHPLTVSTQALCRACTAGPGRARGRGFRHFRPASPLQSSSPARRRRVAPPGCPRQGRRRPRLGARELELPQSRVVFAWKRGAARQRCESALAGTRQRRR